MRLILQTLLYISLLLNGLLLTAQKNFATHYFASASTYNPALVGDTRFGQFNLQHSLQPTTANVNIHTTLLSYNQKIRNMNSGIGISANRSESNFSETQVRINYSYTTLFLRKVWLKGGLGVGLNKLNTHVEGYHFPDQYNHYGYNGLPTREPVLNRKASYVSFALGGAVYGKSYWFSLGADNINLPSYNLGGDITRIPFFINTNGGYLFPLNKNNRPQRIFSRNGGIEPYSSMGPVFCFVKHGPFNVASLGVNTFMNPLFWGIQYRYNSIRSTIFSLGSSSLNFMGGYRNQFISISYSYDSLLGSQVGVTKGAHEVSLIYYLYAIKEDYRKHALLPYPNQLKY